MPRSDEAASWYTLVYRAVQEVPYGKVTSYGHIATLVGYPQDDDCSGATTVGMCLKYLPSASDQPDARYNSDTVPWQRVINSKGIISRRGANGAANQEAALIQEGVEVERGSLGERTVNFSTFGWFPDVLPSEAGADEEEDEEDDEDDEEEEDEDEDEEDEDEEDEEEDEDEED